MHRSPYSCPSMRMTDAAGWVKPILGYRGSRGKTNGAPPSCTSPHINRHWGLGSSEAAPYSTTRRKLSIPCTSIGEANGESHTLQSPKNLTPTAAIQMNFNTRELTIAWHWSISTKMPGCYYRAVCATDLLLRNTIIQKVVRGFGLAPSFHLPQSAPSDC